MVATEMRQSFWFGSMLPIAMLSGEIQAPISATHAAALMQWMRNGGRLRSRAPAVRGLAEGHRRRQRDAALTAEPVPHNGRGAMA